MNVSLGSRDLVATSKTLDKSGERVRDMFAQIAPRYDLLNHVLSLNIDTWWRSKTLRQLALDPASPVLDVCTGTGDLALAIARQLGPDSEVVGTDFCGPMLEIARKKHSKMLPQHPKLRFVEADTQNLPFPSDSFQCVSVAFGLRNVADTILGLKEMIRVVRPGGQVAVLEFSKPKLFGLRQLYQFYFLHVLPRIGQAMAKNDRSAYEYLPQSVQQFPCGEQLVATMQSVGLIRVTMKPMTLGVVTLYIGTKPQS